MHSTVFTEIARLADERSQVVTGMVEAPNGATAVILFNKDAGSWTFARVTLTDDAALQFERAVECARNHSKALKYLSDFTLDAREYVHLEDGSQIENPSQA